MKRSAVLILLAAPALTLSGPALKAEMLSTMPHGTYECALPGDAAGPAWDTIEGKGFRIGRASSYRSAEGSGTYLLEGELLTFTRGPFKGRQLLRTATNELTQIGPDGKRTKLVCMRVGGAR